MPVQILPSYINNNILTPQEQNLVASNEMTRFFGISGDYELNLGTRQPPWLLSFDSGYLIDAVRM